MRELVIRLDDNEWQSLQRTAEQMNCSVEDLIHRVVHEVVAQPQVSPDEWQQRFTNLVLRVYQRTAKYSSEEIEADITAAYEEYRRECGL
jgi:predicted DNA-binding ribbon-helix-helix protein